MLEAWTLIGVLAPAIALAQLKELEGPGTTTAIQERIFRMHHEIGISVGVLPLDPFTKGVFAQGLYATHPTDSLGLELRGGYSLGLHTSLRDQLERDFNILPTAFDEVQLFVGADVTWAPLYGKISVLNERVLHGEIYLLLGGLALSYKNVPTPLVFSSVGINLGGGARLYLNRVVSLRLEVTDNVRLLPVAGKLPSQELAVSLMFALNLGVTE